MNVNRRVAIDRFRLLCVLIIVLSVMITSNVSAGHAKSAADVLQVDGGSVGSNDPSYSHAISECSGPVIYLSGVTTSRYKNDTVADGTIFDRTDWYSDAVGNGYNSAFTVGNSDPPPMDICVLHGVINGHIPLSWTWDEIHSFGGSGDRTHTGRLVLIDGARVHNVQDGWDPRELPEFGNTGIMEMRNTYMTGIRDDSIENDDFMPGFVEDSLFDGVHTFLSEQNESGGTPQTIGPNEDQYIRITRVYVRLISTNSNGGDKPGRWFKWQPRGTTNHNLIITDSVFATHGPSPGDGWDALDFPAGTTFVGTNYILWLGTPGGYEATIPPGVIFLEGQAAIDKWNQVRNTWLTTHGYDPRPLDDFNPMDDPVVAPWNVSISGNVGSAGVTLSYYSGTFHSATSQANGSYVIYVPVGWSGTVTPSKTCYAFSPPDRRYNNVTGNQSAQDFTATLLTETITGNAGVAGATLWYADNGLKTTTADGSGNYSITVPCGWSGTLSPYKTGYMFTPISKAYNNLQSNQTAQNYAAQACANCADVQVSMGGSPMGSYTVPGGAERRENYPVSGGPVIVHSTNGIDLVAAIRLQSFTNNTLYSFVETTGVPQGLLSYKYYFPSYNNIWAPLNSQIRFANLDPNPTTIRVTIGSQSWDYGVPGLTEQRQTFPVSGGPVKVESLEHKQIVAAIRLQSFANNTLYSFAETMGIPAEYVSDTYYFPSYNNIWAPLHSQLRFANLDPNPTTIRVTIGAQHWDYGVPGLTEQRQTFPVSGGPVKVESLEHKQIVAAIRLQSFANNTLYSFAETMGVPAGLLSSKYYFPSYNNTWAPLNSQIRFANLDANPTTIRVTIGAQRWDYGVAGLSEQRQTFPVNGGPVIVESLDPSKKIVATIRLQSFANNTLYSFAETLGIPVEQLSDTYYFPSYNNIWAPLNSQLRFGVP